MNKPTILLADDSSQILTDVSKLLSSQFDVVACVLNGEQAVDEALRLQPDVAVLDVLMPALDGLRAARRLRQVVPKTKIVFLTGLADAGIVATASNLVGSGYVLKSRLYSDLPAAILAALDEQRFYSCEMELDSRIHNMA